MALTIPRVADTLQSVLTHDADSLARLCGFIRRRVKLTGAAFVQGLVFGWLHDPQASLEELCDAIALAGVCLTPQALDQRFTPQAASFLQEVLSQAVTQVLRSDAVTIPLLKRFTAVSVLDSTVFALPAALADQWPGCGGRGDDAGCQARLKVQVRWDLLHGGLTMELQAGRDADAQAALQRAPLPAGALRLADLAYFDLDVLRDYAGQGVYWLTRVQAGTKVYTADGRKWGLWALLHNETATHVDRAVEAGSRHRLPCRLLAIRVPDAVAKQRRQRLLAKAKKTGERVRPERLKLCAWTVFFTNVPAERLTVQEAWVLSRARWQIELLFKLWKSVGGADTSRSTKPYRVLCEVYAKLLAMLVQHWLLLTSCWTKADKSLRKAARRVQQTALRLASALGVPKQLKAVLHHLRRRLQKCRTSKRKGKPLTYQLLLNPAQGS